MKNIPIHIFGSKLFFNILSELDIFENLKCTNTIPNQKDGHCVLIVFADVVPLSTITSILNLKFPTIFIGKKNKHITKRGSENLSVYLNAPLDLTSLLEIVKILKSKFFYLNNSSVSIGKYILDINSRYISLHSKKIKITERELNLILALKNHGTLSKKDILEKVWMQKNILDSHAFETCLHRLRMKFENKFLDRNFIIQENGKYYLS